MAPRIADRGGVRRDFESDLSLIGLQLRVERGIQARMARIHFLRRREFFGTRRASRADVRLGSRPTAALNSVSARSRSAGCHASRGRRFLLPSFESEDAPSASCASARCPDRARQLRAPRCALCEALIPERCPARAVRAPALRKHTGVVAKVATRDHDSLKRCHIPSPQLWLTLQL